MNKLKKSLVSLGTAVAVCMGGLFVTAPAAQAYTNVYSYWEYNCQWDTRTLWTWRDYNWFEETFQFKTDGYYVNRVEYYRC